MKKVLFFDVETNGLNPRWSVLSICMLSADLSMVDGKIHISGLDFMTRYYLPEEDFNPEAVRVNGLDRSEIMKKRGDSEYPLFYREDSEIYYFGLGHDLYVAHNIDFDAQFVPFAVLPYFCTMRASTDLCKLPFPWGSEYKWPRLQEAMDVLKIPRVETVFPPGVGFHDAQFDVACTFSLFVYLYETGAACQFTL